MVALNTTLLLPELEQNVRRWTHRRIANLRVEVLPERVILRGETDTFHSKQLAQQAILEVLPTIRVQNAITVA